MIVKLLTELHLEVKARPNLHLSKCQIVGNPMRGSLCNKNHCYMTGENPVS